MKSIRFEYSDKAYSGAVAESATEVWLTVDGETWTVPKTNATRKSAQKKLSLEPGLLKAPMPGKIIKIAVQKGDKVKTGQTLVVMEAMKMEYVIKADVDGVVEKVGTLTASQQVQSGELLVHIKRSGG